jgi:hypothetical protein
VRSRLHIRALGAVLALLVSGGAQAVALIECAPSGGHACCQKAPANSPDVRPDVPICCQARSAPEKASEPRLVPSIDVTAAVTVVAIVTPLVFDPPVRIEAPRPDSQRRLEKLNCALLI